MSSMSTAAPYSMQPASASTAGRFAWKASSTAARWPGLAVMMATTWIMVPPDFSELRAQYFIPLTPAKAGGQGWIPTFAGMSGEIEQSQNQSGLTMAERSFAREVEALKLGDGETF